MGGSRRRGSHRQSKGKGLSPDKGSVGEAVQQPQRHNARHTQGLKPDLTEVLDAVESLYVDQLKPFGRILRKRIAERAVAQAVEAKASGVEAAEAAAAGIIGPAARGALPFLGEDRKEDSLPDVDIKHLRTICDTSELLTTEEEDGGDWSALLTSRSDPFVDVYSPKDPYPEEMWKVAAEYFDALLDPDMELPGGRYSCAQALVARKLAFLENRSLGEVCHIVQLAISKKKILGYCNGSVVPYSRSQSKVKEECAASGEPCAGLDGGVSSQAMPLATLEDARGHLREILDDIAKTSGGEPAQLPLSNVKRLFRSRYHMELSETTLGHSKLSDLLQDQKFSDVCSVKLEGHGYIVVQVPRPATGSPIALDDLLPQRVSIFCPGDPLDLEAAAWQPSKLCVQNNYPFTPHEAPPVVNTFIQTAGPPPTPLPGARRRSASLPSERQMPEVSVGLPLQPKESLGSGSGDAGHSTAGSAASPVSHALGSLSNTSSQGGSGGAPASPAPSSHQDMPVRLPLLGHDQGLELEPCRAEEHRPRFAVDPLPLEEAGISLAAMLPSPPPPGLAEPLAGSPPPPGLPDPTRQAAGGGGGLPAWSPYAFRTKNTFIQYAATPIVTPAPTASRRTRSLPQKNELEASCNPLSLLKRAPPGGGSGVGLLQRASPKDQPWSPEPAFVPPSPALTASPQAYYFGGGLGFPQPTSPEKQVVCLRLADVL